MHRFDIIVSEGEIANYEQGAIKPLNTIFSNVSAVDMSKCTRICEIVNELFEKIIRYTVM